MSKYRLCCAALAMLFIMVPSAGGQNIEIDTSSPFLSPEYSKRISMEFQEAPLADILKIFSQQTGLNLITVESLASRRITVYLDKVPVDQALEQLLRANNLTYEVQPGSNIYVVKPLPQPSAELITRVYALKHATVSSAQIQRTLNIEGVAATSAGGITDAIKSLLTSQGKLIEDPRTNSLMISDIAANFPTIENAIAKLDVPVPQILIEVEMLEVTKGTADLLGVKIGSTTTNLLGISGAKKDTYFPFKRPTASEITTTLGTVDFSGFTVAMQFLRTQTGTKTLARPRLLTLNNQAAEIKITTNEAVSAEATTISGTGSTSSEATTIERQETGTSLIVTPQANLLTGEITMAIIPKSIITRSTTVGVSTTNPVVKDPEERSSQTILRVQSGDTVIIGGLLRQNVEETISKVPLLSEIPWLGHLFTHKNSSVTDKELIVFLTPHIINETPVPRNPAANIHKLDREQDEPESSPAEIPGAPKVTAKAMRTDS